MKGLMKVAPKKVNQVSLDLKKLIKEVKIEIRNNADKIPTSSSRGSSWAAAGWKRRT